MMSNPAHSVQSRQKHRKVLGVGEGADGKIPRSKVRYTSKEYLHLNFNKFIS